MEENIKELIKGYKGSGRDALIPVLQAVQEAQGYLSREAIVQIGEVLNIATSKIFGVATFYNQFRFAPNGRFHIQVCRGTACHVKGSLALFEVLKKELKIDSGQTTSDGLFSLEVVACIGACGLAPVIAVNGNFHARVNRDDIAGILETYRAKAKEEVQA